LVEFLVAVSAPDCAFPRQAIRTAGPARPGRPIVSRLWLCTALLGLAAGGCSLSYQLGSLLENGEDKLKQSAPPAGPSEEAAAGPSETDLANARTAVAAALAKNGTSKSTAWENADTGARGTITPIAAAAPQDGPLCREFLASYVHAGNETWLEGAACRGQKGRWEVRRLAPWKRT
jgi:surface antigen